ncbi:putative myosin heavy chain [Toxoplasma gondii GAB2-2007-GAL-DOM2]|uniref:Myosin heavy chain n=2 Tax=Toxoplasma gondii TaxID=5811 RepID=V4ZD64_TOXGV|nr:putative myosin heavy chain [Toxoplasma gondii VEG]KFG30913.1 putative myosin heavy chain [Toxoplasma gondii GAB2-2007-GAL-DOM2]
MAPSREPRPLLCSTSCGARVVSRGRNEAFSRPLRDQLLFSSLLDTSFKTKGGGSFGLLREELEVTKGKLLMKEEMCDQLIQENQQLLKSLQTLRREDTNHLHQVKSEAADVVQKLLEEEQLLREANAAMQDKVFRSSESLKHRQAQLLAAQTSLSEAEDQLGALKRFADSLQDQLARLEEERNQLRTSYVDMKKAVQVFARNIAACEFIIDGHCDYDALVRTVGNGIRRLEVDVLTLDAQLFKKGLLTEVPAELLLKPLDERMVPTTEVEKAQRGRRLWQNRHEKVERRLAQQEAEIRKLKGDVDDKNRRIIQLRLLVASRKAKEEAHENLGDRYRKLLERTEKVEKERDELRKWKANHIFYQRHVASASRSAVGSPARAATSEAAKKPRAASTRGSFSPSPRHLSVLQNAVPDRANPPSSRLSTGLLSLPSDQSRRRLSVSRAEAGKSAPKRAPSSAALATRMRASGGGSVPLSSPLSSASTSFAAAAKGLARGSALPQLSRTVPTPQATPRGSPVSRRILASPEQPQTRELSRVLGAVGDAGSESARGFLGDAVGGEKEKDKEREREKERQKEKEREKKHEAEVEKKGREGGRESGVFPGASLAGWGTRRVDEELERTRREAEALPDLGSRRQSPEFGVGRESSEKETRHLHLHEEAEAARKEAAHLRDLSEFLESTPVSLPPPPGPRLSHRSHGGSGRAEASKAKGTRRGRPSVASVSSLRKKRFSFTSPSQTVASLLGKTRTVAGPAFQATSSRSWVKGREEEESGAGAWLPQKTSQRPLEPEETKRVGSPRGPVGSPRGPVGSPEGARAFFGGVGPRGVEGDVEPKGAAETALATFGRRRLEETYGDSYGDSEVRLPRSLDLTQTERHRVRRAEEKSGKAPSDATRLPDSIVGHRTLALIAGRVPRMEAVASRFALNASRREKDIIRHYESLPSTSGRLEEVCGGDGATQEASGSHFPLDEGKTSAMLRTRPSRERGFDGQGETERFSHRELQVAAIDGGGESSSGDLRESSDRMVPSFSSPTANDIIRALEVRGDKVVSESQARDGTGKALEQTTPAFAFSTAGWVSRPPPPGVLK